MLATFKIKDTIDFAKAIADPNSLPDRTEQKQTMTVSEKTLKQLKYDFKIVKAVKTLRQLNRLIEPMLKEDMSSEYHSFRIPKRTKGYRKIDAPNEELKQLQRIVKITLEKKVHCLSHNCAHAYTEKRNTKSALEVHRAFKSKYFLKLDIKDFFKRHNLKYAMKNLEKIYPFGVIIQKGHGELIENIVKINLIKNKMPQGTPLSPLLTNLIMLPIDHEIENKLKSFEGKTFKYTRYADDLLISCKKPFNFKKVKDMIQSILQPTPLRINQLKTRFGSINGTNWNLGLMLNREHQITIGWRKKEIFRASIYNYIRDAKNEHAWTCNASNKLIGNIAYFSSIEPEYISRIITKIETKLELSFKDAKKIHERRK